MTIFKQPYLRQVDSGLRLGDINSLADSIINNNGNSSTYGITSLGTNQATGFQLSSVINEIDASASGTGVNLPNSGGRRNVPFQFCVIINNGVNSVQIYAAKGTTDLINSTLGGTGVSLVSGSVSLFVSAQKGSWFSISGSGGSGGNTRVITDISTSTAAASAANTDYVYSCTGTITLTLPTAVGNTNRYSVTNAGTGTVTVATTGGQTIQTLSGAVTSTAVGPQGASEDFISNNTNWGIY